MKKKFLFVASIALLFFGSSCSTSYSIRTAKNLSLSTRSVQDLITADLKVLDTKVKGTAEQISGKFGLNKEQLENNAIAKALEGMNADVLVEPIFSYDYVHGKLTRVTVSGYPARYNNFRKVEIPEKQTTIVEKEVGPQIVIYGAEVHNSVAPEKKNEQATVVPTQTPQKSTTPNRKK